MGQFGFCDQYITYALFASPDLDKLGTGMINRSEMVCFLVGQDPDTFFSSHNKEANNDTDEPSNEEPLRYSYGQGTNLPFSMKLGPIYGIQFGTAVA